MIVIKYASEQYYHVYNRGVAKLTVFCDAEDKKKFLEIMARYLDPADTSTRYDGVVDKNFLTDYEDKATELEVLKYELANV